MAEETEKTGQVEEVETTVASTETAENTETEGEAKEIEAKEPQTVPFERFQEMTDKVKLLEEQVVNAQQQMAIARANQSQKEPAAKFDIFKEVGLTDEDDVPTVKQYKQILEHHATIFDKRLADLAFHQSHPDFAEYVGTVDEIASGNYAAPLASAIKNNPAIARMIGESPNPRMAAYNIAKLQKTKSEPVKTKEAKDIIDDAKNTSERVKSSSNTKGGEALSEEGRYSIMNDADFLKIAHNNGAFV